MNEGRSPVHADDAARILELLHRVEPLKHLPRTGWVDRGVSTPESVAAHSWRLALLAWIMADSLGLDAGRAMKIALVHDVPEAVTGDRTPFDDQGLTAEAQRSLSINPESAPDWRQPDARARKTEAERRALGAMLAGQSAPLATALQSAWEDYESGASPEARLVYELDKLEAYVQGREYARDGRLPEPETLNSFRLDNERLLQTGRARIAGRTGALDAPRCIDVPSPSTGTADRLRRRCRLIDRHHGLAFRIPGAAEEGLAGIWTFPCGANGHGLAAIWTRRRCSCQLRIHRRFRSGGLAVRRDQALARRIIRAAPEDRSTATTAMRLPHHHLTAAEWTGRSLGSLRQRRQDLRRLVFAGRIVAA